MVDKQLTIYPAIDIRDGKCVRLFKGDYDQETIYDDSPLAVALKWQKLGAKFLHIIDLDGAKEAKPVNLEIIKEIKSKTGLPVQTGGGVRSFETAQQIIDAGIDRVILGSVALKDPDFTKAALEKFASKIVISFDCRNGKVATEGWLEDSEVEAVDLALEMKKHGLCTAVYTDIDRDGTLQGPNLDELKNFATKTQIPTIASGGMSKPKDIEDLQNLKNDGILIEGAIVGKALYTGDIELDKILI